MAKNALTMRMCITVHPDANPELYAALGHLSPRKRAHRCLLLAELALFSVNSPAKQPPQAKPGFVGSPTDDQGLNDDLGQLLAGTLAHN